MYDATGKTLYRDRAKAWFSVMKSRMKTREDGKYFVWDYWDPAGPWDSDENGKLRHWVGVHPNGGYYTVDVEAIVAAYEHGLVFTRSDIDRLIATNRDFMWNKEVDGAKFGSIGGGRPDPRWKDSPGVLWTALVPYDATLRKIFEANQNPIPGAVFSSRRSTWPATCRPKRTDRKRVNRNGSNHRGTENAEESRIE